MPSNSAGAKSIPRDKPQADAVECAPPLRRPENLGPGRDVWKKIRNARRR